MSKPDLSNRMYQIIKGTLKERSSYVLTVIVALTVMGLAQGGLLFIIGPFLKVIVSLSPDQSAIAVRELIPPQSLRYIPEHFDIIIPVASVVLGIPVAIAVIGVVRSVAMYLYQRSQAGIALSVAKNTRTALFDAMVRQKFTALSQQSAAHWMSLIMNDVLYLQMRFSEIMTVLLKDSVLVASCLVAMAFIHWQTAVVLLMICPVIAWSLGRAGKRISFYANFWQRELAKLATFVLDIRQRFVFIRAQGGESREMERFKVRNENYYRSIRRSILLRSAFAPAIEWGGFILFGGFIWVVAKGQWGSDFSSATMVQFFAALGLLIKPLKEMGEQLARYNEVKGSLRESQTILNQKITAADQFGTFSSNRADHPNPTIKMFQIDYDNKPGLLVAKPITLSKGDKIAIIGPSGGGKSTLVKALCGLADPVKWEGDLDQNALAARTSLVSQRPFLFKATLRENLLYGLEDTVDDATLLASLGKFGLEELSLDAVFDPLSLNLSGGQVQRLVILRALLQPKSVLLLDEATSALDTAIETQILSDLFAVVEAEQRVLVVVTHRLGYLEEFDAVWFIEGGRMVASGSHRELMNDDRYRAYVEAGSN